MPRTTDIAKYPPEFLLLLDRAQTGPVYIPHEAPAGLRGYLQSFLLACERTGDGSPLVVKAKALQVTTSAGLPGDPNPVRQAPHVIVQRRSDSIYARRVAAALGIEKPAVDEAADAFMRRMSN